MLWLDSKQSTSVMTAEGLCRRPPLPHSVGAARITLGLACLMHVARPHNEASEHGGCNKPLVALVAERRV